MHKLKHVQMGTIWWGHGERVPPLFQTGGHKMLCPPHFFLSLFGEV